MKGNTSTALLGGLLSLSCKLQKGRPGPMCYPLHFWGLTQCLAHSKHPTRCVESGTNIDYRFFLSFEHIASRRQKCNPLAPVIFRPLLKSATPHFAKNGQEHISSFFFQHDSLILKGSNISDGKAQISCTDKGRQRPVTGRADRACLSKQFELFHCVLLNPALEEALCFRHGKDQDSGRDWMSYLLGYNF